MPQSSPGKSLVALVLRERRKEMSAEKARLVTLKELARIAGYESENHLSYVESGTAGITFDRVRRVARAYELDEHEFQLLWYIARGLDETVPPEALSLLADSETTWREWCDRAHGRGEKGEKSQGPRGRRELRGKTPCRLRQVVAQFLTEQAAVPRDQRTPSETGRAVLRAWRNRDAPEEA